MGNEINLSEATFNCQEPFRDRQRIPIYKIYSQALKRSESDKHYCFEYE